MQRQPSFQLCLLERWECVCVRVSRHPSPLSQTSLQPTSAKGFCLPDVAVVAAELIFRVNVASKLYPIKHNALYCEKHNSKKCVQALLAKLTIIHKAFEHHCTTGRENAPPLLGKAVAESSLLIYVFIHPSYLHGCQMMLAIK